METTQEKPDYQSKKEKKEKKREEKRRAAKRENTTRSIVRWGAALVIIALVIFGLTVLVRGELPQGEDVSQRFEDQGRQHIDVGAQHPPYSSNPPSSGWHYGQTIQTGFYDVGENVFDENIIHNLEHGDIWIAYHPRISDEAREELRTFAAAKVVVASREANDFDVSLVAWGRVDSFDLENGTVPTQRIQDFITRYTNRGPERVTAPIGGHRR